MKLEQVISDLKLMTEEEKEWTKDKAYRLGSYFANDDINRFLRIFNLVSAVPHTPEKFFADFLRGFIENKESVTNNVTLRRGTEYNIRLFFRNREFLEKLQNLLAKQIGVAGKVYGIAYFQLKYNADESKKISEFIYGNEEEYQKLCKDKSQ